MRGQANGDSTGGLAVAFHPYLPTQPIYDAFHFDEFEAGAIGAQVEVGERFVEEVRQIGLVDRRATIGDREPDLIVLFVDGDMNMAAALTPGG